MASLTYYLNATSFSSATAIYSDGALSILAADGYYSDGTKVRQQLAGVLQAEANCAGAPTVPVLSYTFEKLAGTACTKTTGKIYVNNILKVSFSATSLLFGSPMTGTIPVLYGDTVKIEATAYIPAPSCGLDAYSTAGILIDLAPVATADSRDIDAVSHTFVITSDKHITISSSYTFTP